MLIYSYKLYILENDPYPVGGKPTDADSEFHNLTRRSLEICGKTNTLLRLQQTLEHKHTCLVTRKTANALSYIPTEASVVSETAHAHTHTSAALITTTDTRPWRSKT